MYFAKRLRRIKNSLYSYNVLLQVYRIKFEIYNKKFSSLPVQGKSFVIVACYLILRQAF